MTRTTLLLIALGLSLPGRLCAQPVGPPPSFNPTEEPPLADPMNAPRLNPPQVLPDNLTQPMPTPPPPLSEPLRAEPVSQPREAVDPQVQPAQWITPTAPYNPMPAPRAMQQPAQQPQMMGDAGDPPTPIVSVRVYAPATITTGQDLVYRFLVENRSRARANHVEVRAPIPPDTTLIKSVPEPSEKKPAEKPTELFWKIGTMEPGARREIVLTLGMKDAAEVTMSARVKFEHGQTVVTKLAKPSLKIKRVGPSEGVLFDPLLVRLEVTNPGVLSVNNIEVNETLVDGLEFDRAAPIVSTAASRVPAFPVDRIRTNAQGTQRTWMVGSLRPNQTQVLEYRLVPKKTGNLMCRTTLTGTGVREEANGPISILEPKLGVKVEGPTTAYVGQPATYKVIVNNLGDLTLNNVRVLADLPQGCQPIRMSNDGQLFRDAVQWVVTKLEPGGSRTLSLTMCCPAPGIRRTRFTVRADRGLEQSGEAETKFDGVAALNWNATSDPANVKVGDEFTYIIRVDNTGSAPASNLAITVDLPDAVAYRKAEPAHQPAANVLRFTPISIQPGKSETFRFTVQAIKPAQAVFKLEMSADHLDKDQPVRSEPSTTIRGN